MGLRDAAQGSRPVGRSGGRGMWGGTRKEVCQETYGQSTFTGDFTILTAHGPTIPTANRPIIPVVQRPTIPATYGPTIPAAHGHTIPAAHGPTIPAADGPTIQVVERPTTPVVKRPTIPVVQSLRFLNPELHMLAADQLGIGGEKEKREKSGGGTRRKLSYSHICILSTCSQSGIIGTS